MRPGSGRRVHQTEPRHHPPAESNPRPRGDVANPVSGDQTDFPIGKRQHPMRESFLRAGQPEVRQGKENRQRDRRTDGPFHEARSSIPESKQNPRARNGIQYRAAVNRSPRRKTSPPSPQTSSHAVSRSRSLTAVQMPPPSEAPPAVIASTVPTNAKSVWPESPPATRPSAAPTNTPSSAPPGRLQHNTGSSAAPPNAPTAASSLRRTSRPRKLLEVQHRQEVDLAVSKQVMAHEQGEWQRGGKAEPHRILPLPREVAPERRDRDEREAAVAEEDRRSEEHGPGPCSPQACRPGLPRPGVHARSGRSGISECAESRPIGLAQISRVEATGAPTIRRPSRHAPHTASASRGSITPCCTHTGGPRPRQATRQSREDCSGHRRQAPSFPAG